MKKGLKMQTNTEAGSDALPFNSEMVRRSLLKLGLGAIAGAYLPKTAKAIHALKQPDIPEFLRHIDGLEPRQRHRNPICGTCLARLNIRRG